jgi:hypothetical protein
MTENFSNQLNEYICSENRRQTCGLNACGRLVMTVHRLVASSTLGAEGSGLF